MQKLGRERFSKQLGSARALSGGQQQRVAIGRALVHDPKLIVCDEPTGNLDNETGHSIMEVLRGVAKSPDRALIVVTHDMRIYDFADRIARMDDGKIEDHRDHQQQEKGAFVMIGRYVLPLLALIGLTITVGAVIQGNQTAPLAPPVVQSPEVPFAAYVAGAGMIEASNRKYRYRYAGLRRCGRDLRHAG
jgi:energy-coupling factor transporter ATP-binding protein EcfA2